MDTRLTTKLMDAPPMTPESNDAQPARSHAAHGSALDRLPLMNLKCCKCGATASISDPEACGCWEKCSCGWLNAKGAFCSNPKTMRCSNKLKYGKWDRRLRAYVPNEKGQA